MSKKKISVNKILVYALALLWFVITFYPVFWLVMNSLKTNFDLLGNPWGLPIRPAFKNYKRAWEVAKIGTYFFNSIYLTLVPMIIGLVLSLLAVYPISRVNTKLNFFLYLLFVFGIIIPVNSLLVPLFVMYSRLKLIDSQFGLLLFYTSRNIPFNIFIIYGFLKTVPLELDESAIIDGANVAQIIVKIMVPVIKPAIATTSILNFLTKWNEFLYALTFLSSQKKRTLPCGLTYFFDMFSVDYAPMLAGIVVSIAPIVIFYILMEKNVVAGLTAGAVKG
jgi:raffinose/stachyose/melibiose transport system permease protein